MINLHERMLLDPVGIEPATTDHQLDVHLTEPPRPVTVVIIGDLFHYYYYLCFFYFCTKYEQIPQQRPSLGWPKSSHISGVVLILNMEYILWVLTYSKSQKCWKQLEMCQYDTDAPDISILQKMKLKKSSNSHKYRWILS